MVKKLCVSNSIQEQWQQKKLIEILEYDMQKKEPNVPKNEFGIIFLWHA